MKKNFGLIILLILFISISLSSCASKDSQVSSETMSSTLVAAVSNESTDESTTTSQEVSESSQSQVSVPADDIVDNSQRNLNANSYFGGYVAENDGTIYYSNKDDGNKLYKMDKDGTKTKLSDISSEGILLDIKIYNGTLFYTCDKKDSNTLYSLDMNKNTEKKLFDNVVSYTFYDNNIYLTTISKNAVYKMNLDGTASKKLRDLDYPMFIQVFNNTVYLSYDEMLMTLKLDGTGEEIFNVNHHELIVYGNDVYYIELNDWCLYRMNDWCINKAGAYESSRDKISKEKIHGFNICGNTIYYISEKDDLLYKCDLNGNNIELVLGKECSNPVITENWIYVCTDVDNVIIERIEK